ncbi:efflux pump membrane transporter BepG [Pseudomonas antarctica]|uniref:Efflux pump membrane transporter BepG n=1 Tax=Pseudomonas antarctica TaxID=219572 RepID=A0ABQ6ZSK7_9PSED|nr:efflux pump membrane transporter BepG [Pseudomonas antarctica]
MVDREKIAALGMTQADVGAALSAALGGNYVNNFSTAGCSYRVIPQVLQVNRLNPEQILDYYIRTPAGAMIQARTVAHIETSTQPESINHFQPLNSATLSGVSAVGQGELLAKLKRRRPILMTTAARVLGVVPLVWACGAGAAGRHDMGLVIFAGLSIGTLLTLFMVPAMYMFIGETHHQQTQQTLPGSDLRTTKT